MSNEFRLIDTHTHVASAQFDADRADILVRAAEAGVARIIEIGDNLEPSRAAVALAIEGFERGDLLDAVWGEGWIGDPRTLDVHIRWLRQKIEDDPALPRYILTVRGLGYRFATSDEVAR